MGEQAAEAASASVGTSEFGSDKARAICRGPTEPAKTKSTGDEIMNLPCQKAGVSLAAPRQRRGSKQQKAGSISVSLRVPTEAKPSDIEAVHTAC